MQVHLGKWFCSYDFKCKRVRETNFSTFCIVGLYAVSQPLIKNDSAFSQALNRNNTSFKFKFEVISEKLINENHF